MKKHYPPIPVYGRSRFIYEAHATYGTRDKGKIMVINHRPRSKKPWAHIQMDTLKVLKHTSTLRKLLPSER